MSLKSLSKLNKMLETLTDKEIGENKPGLKTGAISSLDGCMAEKVLFLNPMNFLWRLHVNDSKHIELF